MSKPLIGVMPLWDEGKKSIWMLPGYLEGIREAGGDLYRTRSDGTIGLEYVIKEDKAVLGICRGIQYLNAMLGGRLYQKALWRHVIGEKCEIILIWNWKN